MALSDGFIGGLAIYNTSILHDFITYFGRFGNGINVFVWFRNIQKSIISEADFN